MTNPPAPADDDTPEVSRWLSEGGADLKPRGPVERAEVLEVLDFLAAHVPGHPIASGMAARLAAAIRVRGLISRKD